ncbi:hypothetical protein IIC65_09320 [Candidatus Sumerlaeota bacterium]|nr:hypothetical protein [Candidatus Sumerlaeota bacterium]
MKIRCRAALPALIVFTIWTATPLGAQSRKYAEVEVTDGGTIRGKVTFKGPVPALTLRVIQDMSVCTHTAGLQPSPRLEVDAHGGVAGTVVYLREIAEGKPLSKLVAPLRLDQAGCTYVPFIQVAPYNRGRLDIVNSDAISHNVHMKQDGNTLLNLPMPNVGTKSWPLRRSGLLSVECDIHRWMSAYIFVVRHPYYAITGADGSFELSDIPAGTYELVAWHAAWDGEEQFTRQGESKGYKYSDPIEKTMNVPVEAGSVVTIDFVLND